MRDIPRQSSRAASVYDCLDQLKKADDALVASELLEKATQHLQAGPMVFSKEILKDFESILLECRDDYSQFFFELACQTFSEELSKQKTVNSDTMRRIELTFDGLVNEAFDIDEEICWRAITSLTDLFCAYGSILPVDLVIRALSFLILGFDVAESEIIKASKLELRGEVYDLLETDFDLLS